MDEQSKSRMRRLRDWRFANRWFVGRGIDVGCGPDPLNPLDWQRITEIVPYDVMLGHKDGQSLPEIPDASFDFVHNSHVLEHLRQPKTGLTHWLRVLKPGGFIIGLVPDEFLYECGQWPSRYNSDHKNSFSARAFPIINSSVDIINLLWRMRVDIEHFSLLTENWSKSKFGQDQTLGQAECAMEFVIRKPDPKQSW